MKKMKMNEDEEFDEEDEVDEEEFGLEVGPVCFS
jgi:hypothetical protein